MVSEKHHSITLDEILAFQFQCKSCGVKTVFPVGKNVMVRGSCGHCSNVWLSPTPQIMGTIGIALQDFMNAIATIVTHAQEIGVNFSLEIKGEKNEERK